MTFILACVCWFRDRIVADEWYVASVDDIKAICMGEDVLERTVEHMTAYDPEWKIPEGFFRTKVPVVPKSTNLRGAKISDSRGNQELPEIAALSMGLPKSEPVLVQVIQVGSE